MILEPESRRPDPSRSDALAELIRCHTSAMDRLERFSQEHPYIIAPNVLALIRHNLEDNQALLAKCRKGKPSP